MSFRANQLGRFGSIGIGLITSDDPDQAAAHLYARNGKIVGSRPTVEEILASKGLWDPNDPQWDQWAKLFILLRDNHCRVGGRRLVSVCTAPHPRHPNECWHEIVPPLDHCNLRWFAQNVLPSLADNVVPRADGSFGLPTDFWPIWNFVITPDGEILVSKEDYGVIKHTSISGGREVWSAGQVGIESRLIRLVDLQSGHYVKPNVLQNTQAAQDLIDFTKEVFRQYSTSLGINCLHPSFECIWA